MITLNKGNFKPLSEVKSELLPNKEYLVMCRDPHSSTDTIFHCMMNHIELIDIYSCEPLSAYYEESDMKIIGLN